MTTDHHLHKENVVQAISRKAVRKFPIQSFCLGEREKTPRSIINARQVCLQIEHCLVLMFAEIYSPPVHAV